MAHPGEDYREATAKMDAMGVDPEYVLGWQGGYLGHPKREEQRVSEAYDAGYSDGEEKETGNFDKWVKS
jgi:hypothetical protein